MQYNALSSKITLHSVLLLWICKLLNKLRATRTPGKKTFALIYKSQRIFTLEGGYSRVLKAHSNSRNLAFLVHTSLSKAKFLTPLYPVPGAPSATLLMRSPWRHKQNSHSYWPPIASIISTFALALGFYFLSISVLLTLHRFSSSANMWEKGTAHWMLAGWEHRIEDWIALNSNSGSAIASWVTHEMGVVVMLALL